MMVFLCFSSNERYSAAKSCLYHLKNYGISTWYDYHELILGDHKAEKNFKSAIHTCNYFVIIYSKEFFKSPCAVKEENLIFKEKDRRAISIFPILYNLQFSELPDKYQEKLENLIYNEVTTDMGCLSATNQIVSKILINKMGLNELDHTPQITEELLSELNDAYLYKILSEYLQISSQNFNARIAILYCAFIYISKVIVQQPIPYYLTKIMTYLSTFTKLNIKYNHKELIIAELVILHCLKLLR